MKPTSDPGQVLVELKNQAGSHPSWGSREILFVLLAVTLIAALLFLWAAYIRKPKRRGSGKEVIASPIFKTSRRSGRRLRKRKTKRRNPTLAETGGLPPRKQECVISNSR